MHTSSAGFCCGPLFWGCLSKSCLCDWELSLVNTSQQREFCLPLRTFCELPLRQHCSLAATLASVVLRRRHLCPLRCKRVHSFTCGCSRCRKEYPPFLQYLLWFLAEIMIVASDVCALPLSSEMQCFPQFSLSQFAKNLSAGAGSDRVSIRDRAHLERRDPIVGRRLVVLRKHARLPLSLLPWPLLPGLLTPQTPPFHSFTDLLTLTCLSSNAGCVRRRSRHGHVHLLRTALFHTSFPSPLLPRPLPLASRSLPVSLLHAPISLDLTLAHSLILTSIYLTLSCRPLALVCSLWIATRCCSCSRSS